MVYDKRHGKNVTFPTLARFCVNYFYWLLLGEGIS
jgi:hypothetical protein